MSIKSDNEYSRKWSKENPDRSRAIKKRWRDRHRDQCREYSRKYYLKNRDRIRLRNQDWIRRNPDFWARNARRRRSENDSIFKMTLSLRRRFNRAMRGKSKSESVLKLIGCSVEDFWIYLESKFETGMTRQNYGTVWHVDHIIPCAIFDLTKPEHQRRCFHFSNLQPLFAKDNLTKNSKVITNQFNLL